MKIMVSAGEVSGDVHGSYLIKELKNLRPDIYFFGMGSDRLAAEGMDIKCDISKRGTIGIFEALPNILPIYLNFIKMKRLLLEEKPDLVLLIDSQGFNLPFASYCKKHGFKTAYYIAPQEWLWGTPRGVKKVVNSVDLILAIFQKEYDVYKKAGGQVVYFGHPLLDIVRPSLSKSDSRLKFLGENIPGPVIALCPGSRIQEIRGLLPALLLSGEIILKEFPRAKFLIPVASAKIIKDIFNLIGDFRPKAIIGSTYEILNASDLAICVSGTINLEASILKVPNLMVYKLSLLTYLFGKYVLKIGDKLPFFSMPNLLLGKPVIPELTMKDAHPQVIASQAISILKDPVRHASMLASFEKLNDLLGMPGSIHKYARSILNFI